MKKYYLYKEPPSLWGLDDDDVILPVGKKDLVLAINIATPEVLSVSEKELVKDLESIGFIPLETLKKNYFLYRLNPKITTSGYKQLLKSIAAEALVLISGIYSTSQPSEFGQLKNIFLDEKAEKANKIIIQLCQKTWESDLCHH